MLIFLCNFASVTNKATWKNMNAISLNNLWSYLQGLSLTASNQRWLASHMMEAADSVEKKHHN